MSLEIHFWNIVVPKKILELKYPGGPEQFKKDCPNKMFQEDEYLASYSFMNEYDVDTYMNRLIQKGLIYDRNNDNSEDFVVLAMEVNGGLWWNVDWIDHDSEICWHKKDDKSKSDTPDNVNIQVKKDLSQSKQLYELKKCIDYISEITYENFISSFNLNKNDFKSLTIFESKISTLFLLDYFITSKNISREFRDNLYHICSTKIQNDYSNELENKILENIIQTRYMSYAKIPGIAKERWQQSYHRLLDINLKGTKNLKTAKEAYPTTLEDGDKHLQQNINFITLETENSYRFLRLIDEILSGTSFEDAVNVIEGIENKSKKVDGKPKREGCYIATMVYGDYNSEEVILLRAYRDNKLIQNNFGKTFLKWYYFISPYLVRLLKDKKHINSLIRRLLDYIIKKTK